MARPNRTNPNLFTTREVEHGTGLTVRQLQFLRDKDWAPMASIAGDQAGANMYSVAGVMHFALVGALLRAGLTISGAARLARHIPDEMGDFHLGKLSRWIELPTETQKRAIQGIEPPAQSDELYLRMHHELRRSGVDTALARQSRDRDVILEIADKRFVMLSPEMRLIRSPDPVGELGDGDTFVPAHALADMDDPDDVARLSERFAQARQEAVAILSVNLSRFVRHCFDAIHDERMNKGGKLFAAWGHA